MDLVPVSLEVLVRPLSHESMGLQVGDGAKEMVGVGDMKNSVAVNPWGECWSSEVSPVAVGDIVT